MPDGIDEKRIAFMGADCGLTLPQELSCDRLLRWISKTLPEHVLIHGLTHACVDVADRARMHDVSSERIDEMIRREKDMPRQYVSELMMMACLPIVCVAPSPVMGPGDRTRALIRQAHAGRCGWGWLRRSRRTTFLNPHLVIMAPPDDDTLVWASLWERGMEVKLPKGDDAEGDGEIPALDWKPWPMPDSALAVTDYPKAGRKSGRNIVEPGFINHLRYADAEAIRKRYRDGEKATTIASSLGVSIMNVGDILLCLDWNSGMDR